MVTIKDSSEVSSVLPRQMYARVPRVRVCAYAYLSHEPMHLSHSHVSRLSVYVLRVCTCPTVYCVYTMSTRFKNKRLLVMSGSNPVRFQSGIIDAFFTDIQHGFIQPNHFRPQRLWLWHSALGTWRDRRLGIHSARKNTTDALWSGKNKN